MTLEEKIAMANQVRSRDRFGPVSPEELAALPGTETELWIETENGCKVHVFEERPDTLPEKAALLLNFHGGGFIKGRTDRDRRYCCTLMERLNCLVWEWITALHRKRHSRRLSTRATALRSMLLTMLQSWVLTRKRSYWPGTAQAETLWRRPASRMQRRTSFVLAVC